MIEEFSPLPPPGTLLGWQNTERATPAAALAAAVARFAEKYGVAPTWAEVHPSDAHLTAPGVTVFPNRAVRPGTYRVGVKP